MRAVETQEIWVWSLGQEDPWSRKWQSTPIFLPGKSHGEWSLVGLQLMGLQRVRHDWVTEDTRVLGLDSAFQTVLLAGLMRSWAERKSSQSSAVGAPRSWVCAECQGEGRGWQSLLPQVVSSKGALGKGYLCYLLSLIFSAKHAQHVCLFLFPTPKDLITQGLMQVASVPGCLLWPTTGKISPSVIHDMGFPGGSVVKNLPVKQETWVQSLGQEDPLEKEMAAHSCILAWKIPWTEEPGGLQSIGSQESDTVLINQ